MAKFITSQVMGGIALVLVVIDGRDSACIGCYLGVFEK